MIFAIFTYHIVVPSTQIKMKVFPQCYLLSKKKHKYSRYRDSRIFIASHYLVNHLSKSVIVSDAQVRYLIIYQDFLQDKLQA